MRWITKVLGFECRRQLPSIRWKEKLAAATPKGIDIDFEMLVGEIMQSLNRMNLHGASHSAALISATQSMIPPRQSGNILVRRLRVQGFIILDYASRFMEAAKQLVSGKCSAS